MEHSIFEYIQRMALIGFFSGYCLVYLVIVSIVRNRPSIAGTKKSITSMLPYSYALAGTLYLAFQLKQLYPAYSFEISKTTLQQSFLIIWGLSALLFWMPLFRKRIQVSVLHSLVFLGLVAGDLFLYTFRLSGDETLIKNDMKMYTASLLLYIILVTLVAVGSFFASKIKKRLPFHHQ